MPRSPSRDRSDRFTGFRGYVRVPDRYARAKGVALLSAGVFVGLWLVVEAAHPRAAAFHTHGPLANPHAAWDQDCAACHREQGIASFQLSEVLNARGRWHDLTCTKCHAGPAHHDSVAAAGGEWAAFHDRCLNCHHDHAGRTASLTDISDDHCVRCHKDIKHGGSTDLGAYTSFATIHAEFRALREHPPGTNDTSRKLKFSHAVHMTPGLTVGLTPEGVAKRNADGQARYAGFTDGKLVALTCAACHQLDAGLDTKASADTFGSLLRGQPRAAVLPPRAEGAYYLPINFDAHCQACHPTIAPGVRPKETFPVPHRLPPAELAPFLRAGYWERLASTAAVPPAPLPGGRLDAKNPVADAKTTYGAEVDRLTAAAQTWLATRHTADDQLAQGTCAKCHELTGSGTGAALGVAPLPRHTVWFEHAKFNHVSHRGLTCAECHPGTGASGSVNEVEPIAIRGVKSCRACHAPAGAAVEQDDGTRTTAAGVRHRCTDCHRYHNGDRPLHGLGSPHRDPAAPLSLADFLKGGK